MSISEPVGGRTSSRRRFLPRYGLGPFLVACCGLGALLGLAGRYWLIHPRYFGHLGMCDGFRLEADWSQWPGEREHLQRMVVLPPFAVSCFREIVVHSGPVRTKGLDIQPDAIYLRGRKVVAPHGERVYIFVASVEGGDIRPVPGTDGSDADLSYSDFRNLGVQPIWKQKILPKLRAQLGATGAKDPKKDVAVPSSRQAHSIGKK